MKPHRLLILLHPQRFSIFPFISIHQFLLPLLFLSSLANCSLFEDSCANQESTDAIPDSSSFHNAVDNLKFFRSSNKALSAMSSNKNWHQYGSSLSSVYAAFIILAVLSLVIWVIQMVSMFCARCCKCLLQTREQLNSLSDRWTYCWMASCFVLTGMAIGVSIAGLAANRPIKLSTNYGICQTLNLTNTLVQGISGSTYLGIAALSNKVTTLQTQLLASYASYTAAFASSTFLSNLSVLSADLTNMQTALLTMTPNIVTLPNPDRMNNPKSVLPDILYKLGTRTILDVSTVMGSLEWEYETKTVFQTRLLDKLKTSAAVVGSTATTTLNASINSALSLITTFKQNIQDFYDLVQTEMETVNFLASFVKTLSDAVYGVVLSATIVGTLGIFATAWWKVPMVRYIVHFAWMVVSLMCIVSFGCAGVAYTLSMSLMENCEGMADLSNTSTLFDKYINFIGATELKTCFFDDGNLATQFGLETTLQQLLEVQSDLANAKAKDDIFTDLNSNRFIYKWIQNVTSNLAFTTNAVEISSNESGFMTLDSPISSLDALNSWSDFDYQPADGVTLNSQYALGCGSISRDKIVMTAAQCPTGVPTCSMNDGAPCCIVISLPANHITSITSRLQGFTLSSCNSLSTFRAQYLRHYTYLFQYAQDLISILNTVSTQFVAYQTSSNAYLTQLDTLYASATTTLTASTSSLSATLSDASTGLLTAFQCTFLKKQVQNIHNSLCRSTMVRMYKASAFLITISILALLSQISFFIAARRLLSLLLKDRVTYFTKSSSVGQIINPNLFMNYDPNNLDQSMQEGGDDAAQLIQQETATNVKNNNPRIKNGLLEDIQNKNATFYSKNSQQSPSKIGNPKSPLKPPANMDLNLARPNNNATYIEAVLPNQSNRRSAAAGIASLNVTNKEIQQQGRQSSSTQSQQQQNAQSNKQPAPTFIENLVDEDDDYDDEENNKKKKGKKPQTNAAALKSVIR